MIESDMSVEQLTDCDIKRQVTYSVAEHEVLISFNNDEGAEVFDEWWQTVGKNQFVDWVSYWKK